MFYNFMIYFSLPVPAKMKKAPGASALLLHLLNFMRIRTEVKNICEECNNSKTKHQTSATQKAIRELQ